MKRDKTQQPDRTHDDFLVEELTCLDPSLLPALIICGWCLNLISVPSIGLGHYDPLSSHEIDGVRKEKERLTAAWTSHTFGLTAHSSWFQDLISGDRCRILSSFS